MDGFPSRLRQETCLRLVSVLTFLSDGKAGLLFSVRDGILLIVFVAQTQLTFDLFFLSEILLWSSEDIVYIGYRQKKKFRAFCQSTC